MGKLNDPEAKHAVGWLRAPKEEARVILKNLRKAKRMSQATVADIIGVSRITAYGCERCDYMPSVPIIRKLADLYEVDLAWLVCYIDDTYIPNR